MNSSAHLSGSILGQASSNGNPNSAGSSLNMLFGTISVNLQIVQEDSVLQDQQQPPSMDLSVPPPGNPDLESETEVVELSPKTLMNKTPYVCDICDKEFHRRQNLELHKRFHQLPYNLRRDEIDNNNNNKKVYRCPILGCARNNAAKALLDIAGIKKHFFRKHCRKTLQCPQCSKLYAVKCDMRAHMLICGKNTYRCSCDSVFRRIDTFNKHKRSCETVAAERNNQYVGNIAPPPGFRPLYQDQHNINNPPLGFDPRHHHRVINFPPPPQVYAPVPEPPTPRMSAETLAATTLMQMVNIVDHHYAYQSLPIHHYYNYNYKHPTRDFLSLSGGNRGSVTTNLNLIGGGLNVSGEGGEGIPWCTNPENQHDDNGRQDYTFVDSSTSTSRISGDGSLEAKNMQK